MICPFRRKHRHNGRRQYFSFGCADSSTIRCSSYQGGCLQIPTWQTALHKASAVEQKAEGRELRLRLYIAKAPISRAEVLRSQDKKQERRTCNTSIPRLLVKGPSLADLLFSAKYSIYWISHCLPKRRIIKTISVIPSGITNNYRSFG